MEDKFLEKQNNKFYRFTEWVYRLIYLNVLWMLFSLMGIIVIGLFPATFAVFDLLKRFKQGKDLNIYQEFKAYFFKNLKKANYLGYIHSIIIGFIIIDISYFYQNSDNIMNLLAFYILIFISLILSMVTLYLPLVYVYFPKFTLKETYKFSFLLSVGLPLKSFLLLLVTGGLVFFFFVFISTIYFILISFPAFIFISIVHHKFMSLMKTKTMMKIDDFSYASLSQYNQLDNIRDLWNQAYEDKYQITQRLFEQLTLKNQDVNFDDSFICLDDDNHLVGYIIIQTSFYKDYEDNAWINLFFVKKEYRNLGIGSQLLMMAENNLQKKGKRNLQLGAGFHPYFPGLPSDLDNSLFFDLKGFHNLGYTYDLIGTIDNPFQLSNNLKYRYLEKQDDMIVNDFLKTNFNIRWYYEWKEYLKWNEKEEDLKEYIGLFREERLIGFIRKNSHTSKEIMHNINWMNHYEMQIGGVGPLGIDTNERGKGYGLEIVKIGVNALLDEGIHTIRIDWTNHVNFYGKLGFKIEKKYISYKKDISEVRV